jgi:predicted DNA binding CopG/RHH family protein
MKPVQYFSDEYLAQSQKMSTKGILEFLESFRLLSQAGRTKSRTKLISLKVDEVLLEAFKRRAGLENKKYQTLIKELMLAHLAR